MQNKKNLNDYYDISTNILEIDSLSKKYGGILALDNLSVSINRNKIIGLLGPNGCGKTTFMKIVSGLLTPDQGSVLVDGKNVGVETKKIVSFLPDVEYLNNWMTLDQLINQFDDFYEDFDKPKAVDLMKNLGLDVSMRLKALSKGNKEKVQLVLCMSRKAQLYLLDEPIGGVDPAAREVILDLIVNNYVQDSTLIISTHLVSDIERIFDEVIFLKYGVLSYYGSVDNMRTEYGKSVNEVFKEVFRC